MSKKGETAAPYGDAVLIYVSWIWTYGAIMGSNLQVQCAVLRFETLDYCQSCVVIWASDSKPQ